MNSPLAQIVALTCYGNASLNGASLAPFFPGNSTCQYCDSLTWVELKKNLFGNSKEKAVALTFEEWIARLRKSGATAIRLQHESRNNPTISDRMSAGFVGGGGYWNMEVLRADGQSDFWAARWVVWNKQAPGDRIWRVTYGLLNSAGTRPDTRRGLAAIEADFKKALEAIHAFSARESCGGFTDSFAKALHAFANPDSEVEYHKDLIPPNQLSASAASMLKATSCAWVFGGMGSWNDMGFQGATQQEYEKVSDDLFNVMNEAVAVAASSGARTVPAASR